MIFLVGKFTSPGKFFVDCFAGTSVVPKSCIFILKQCHVLAEICTRLFLRFLRKVLFNSALTNYWTPHIIWLGLSKTSILRKYWFLQWRHLFRRNGLMSCLFRPDYQPFIIITHHHPFPFHVPRRSLPVINSFSHPPQYFLDDMEGSVPQCRWKVVSGTEIFCDINDGESIYNF